MKIKDEEDRSIERSRKEQKKLDKERHRGIAFLTTERSLGWKNEKRKRGTTFITYGYQLVRISKKVHGCVDGSFSLLFLPFSKKEKTIFFLLFF